MGLVLEAWDPLLERLVAIKLPHRELLAESGAAEKLVQEARAAAALVDDHVVPIHSVEVTDELPYLVMPLLAGVTLKQRLEDEGVRCQFRKWCESVAKRQGGWPPRTAPGCCTATSSRATCGWKRRRIE